MNYYGQQRDDKLIEFYFEKNYIGGCIDIGASDGVGNSNTKYFEEKGWYCLCIEPNLVYFNQLKINRKNAIKYAISNFNGEAPPLTLHLLKTLIIMQMQ